MDPFDALLEQRVGCLIGGHWILRRLIGAGGMAAVYAAESANGQWSAIKLLHPEMGARNDIRERFLREAAVMQQLVHPGMVTIYEQGIDADTAYLAMELLSGESIATRVRRLRTLPASEVLLLLDQLLDVLSVAHAQGIIHRDVKPDNLFLTQEGRVKVLDFGLARLLYEGAGPFRTRTGTTLGTLPYMAPEQALGHRNDVDARTDLFAVGATAFRLLSGRRIHEGANDGELLLRMATEPAPPLLSIVPDVPQGLALIVDRALAFQKLQRYPDASQMQRDVRNVLQGTDPAYALALRCKDDSATRIERALVVDSARPLSTTAKEPEFELEPSRNGISSQVKSQRGIAPTVVMPLSLRQGEASPVSVPAPTASMVAVDTAPSTPISLRIASEPTVTDYGLKSTPRHPHEGYAAPSPPLPVNAVSGVTMAHQRKRTFVIGLGLFLVLLVVTTFAMYTLIASHSPKP